MGESPEYVKIGAVTDILRSEYGLGIQNQYVSHYVEGIAGSPNLGEGLRFRNLETSSYHEFEINKDDVKEFAVRIAKHRGAEKCK